MLNKDPSEKSSTVRTAATSVKIKSKSFYCVKWDSLYLKWSQGNVLQNASGVVRFGEIALLVSDPCSSAQALLSILANTLRPDRGEVRYHPSVRMRDTTFVSNYEAEESLFSISVKDSIATHVIRCLPADVPDEERNLIIGLTQMNILSRRDSVATDLSRCEAKYLILLQALSVPHRLILLDEPFEGLRYSETLSILKILQELKSKGYAVVLSSSVHPEILMKFADTVHIFGRQGILTFSGDTKTFLDSIETSDKSRQLDDLIKYRGKEDQPPKQRDDDQEDRIQLIDVVVPDNQELVSNTFTEVLFKGCTDDNSVLTHRVLTNGVFMFALVSLSKKRSELSDVERPLYNMNLYFIFHLFLAIQSFYFGYQITVKACSVINNEYFNCNYLLASSAMCALSSIHTMIEGLCTVALSVFVFLVTDQQQLYIGSSWKSAGGQEPMSAWSPFLFSLSALVNSFNFGRLGFYAGVLKVQRKSLRSAALSMFYLGMVLMILCVISCRFHDMRGKSSIQTSHKVLAYLSPLSRLQEMTFFSVYGTRDDVYCLSKSEIQSANLNSSESSKETRSCKPFRALVDGQHDSLMVLPLWSCAVSILLVLMFALRVHGTITFAMKLYEQKLRQIDEIPLNPRSTTMTTQSDPKAPVLEVTVP